MKKLTCNHYDTSVMESYVIDGVCHDDWVREYCDVRRFRNSDYCENHLCGYYNCLEYYTCDAHRCKANASEYISVCGKIIFNINTQYCVDHICLGKDCIYGKECEIHMCIDCREGERYIGYNKCLNCLSYVDVIKPMVISEFYFGMIPRDIVGILIEYIPNKIEIVFIFIDKQL